ncbi:MAG: cardiolipin synthase ClsB [Pseudomonadota bacterium]
MNSGNRITLLHNGDAYFPALETALDRAVYDIYLETYIFENDHTGRRIAEALRRAAMRGVLTHLLIDGFGSSGLPKTMIDYLKEAGVMVLKFRPQISPWTLRRRRLRRLHRKIAVIDQSFAFVGGINIIDDVDTPGQVSPRYDYAVSVEGPLVKKIYTSTRRLWLRVVWSRRLRFDWHRDKKRQVPPPKFVGHMKSTFLVRDNFRHRRAIENGYLHAIAQAQSEIILANAYFLPGRNFRQALLTAAGRGVRVVLLLQGKMEHRLAHYASRALFGTFLDAGIEIYEYHQSILHAKVAVIDKHWATVGSSNLDPFSLLLALEANIVVDDQNFASALRDSLERAIKAGARRVFENNWILQPFMLRLVCWLSYGLIRFMTGIAGEVPKSNK